MVNIQKQVDYWRDGSEEDMHVADVLFRNKKFSQGLFFAHLAIEKILKAHVTVVTGSVPPKSHNFFRLIEIAELKLPDDYLKFLRYFSKFQIEGRYPEQKKVIIDKESAKQDIKKAKEILKWIRALR